MSNIKKEAKSETIATKVKPSIKKKLVGIAKRRDRKLSHVVNQIIESYVN